MSQLLYFTAAWCGPCKLLKPQLNKLTVPFRTINIDNDMQIANQYNVRNIPCFIKINAQGQEVSRLVGNNVTLSNIERL
jgi:thioredoxin-like negative regulator of GroEL|tara:strand:+ start:228 stop:464 length:237 start_codon:yes stop_codon:yes gene_type:complete